jgi:hypothetical protein
MTTDTPIENNSQQAITPTGCTSITIEIPSDEVLTEAARPFWDGDSVFDQYDRKLAVDYFKYVIANYTIKP